jgi:type II secretory ATPase GspE/PulE/Tfp pilus assembly ATPase PilB-like protein/tetratricopeptide (TPR) repeat protein
MDQCQASGLPNVDLKMKEAETCYAMGMTEEALELYEQVVASPNAIPAEARQTLSEKVARLKQEIQEQKASEKKGLSAEHISVFKKALSAQEDVTTLLDGAAALKELGLMEEAAAEYQKLVDADAAACDVLKSNGLPGRIIRDYLACLLEIRDPAEVVKAVYKVVYKFSLGNHETAQIQLWLGRELEQKDMHDLSFELYQAAAEMDPADTEIADRLKALKAKLSSNSRYDYLMRSKLISTQQLQDALTISKKVNKSVEFVLMDRFKVNIQEIGKSLAMFYGCPFRTFDADLPVPFELINNLKKSFLLYYVWVPLRWDKTGIEILVDDPKDLRKTDHIRALMGNQKINISVAVKEDVDKYIQHFFDPRVEKSGEPSVENIDQILPDVSFEEEEELQDDRSGLDESSSQIVKFVDQILVTAFRNTASDIHIEPSPLTRKTTIRFRTDGVCHEYIQVPNAMAPAIISRLKIMAELDIAEKRLPQDGKIKVRRKGLQEFELRLSTMPTVGKFEDAVMRILTRTTPLKIDQIGLHERNLTVLKKLIARPYGMILCVGPTGSGKTTTLHAVLGHINQPGVKIWTAEDPVEITQPGLRQVQVRSKIGLDFARIMRGFLRLDPDIIMIGEMRDRETAAIGLEAALTGHLVFSTLHTNNAPETLTRLLEMGMNALNISDAFLGVLGQRLVRRLCTNCMDSYRPTEEEFEDLRTDYGREAFDRSGFSYGASLSLKRSAGCEKCNGSGYKGRIGIHEMMEATPEVKLLLKRNATSHDLAVQAAKDGMTTLKQDGIRKTINGITTIREVRRVCIE